MKLGGLLWLVWACWSAAQGDAAGYGKLSNESLLWGPYKPNLYFGLRPRIPKSLSATLMWSRVDSFETVQKNFRAICEQNTQIDGYGWDEYDTRLGGRQTIHDVGNHLEITIDYVKFPGGSHGGSWGARVSGRPMADAPPTQTTAMIFDFRLEGLGSLAVANEPSITGYDETVTLKGHTVELGDFRIDMPRGPASNKHPPPIHDAYSKKPLDRTLVYSLNAEDKMIWQHKPVLFTHMKEEVDKLIAIYGDQRGIPPQQIFTIANSQGAGNVQFVQHVFHGPFTFDVLFSSASSGKQYTSDDLTSRIHEVSKAVSERFDQRLAPKSPFDQPQYVKFAKAMFSNLIGGIGYFHGDSLVDRSYAPEYDEENEGFWQQAASARERALVKLEGPHELFTSIPSRPFFPRGFLWDEGFHLLPVAEWDMDLTLSIIRSWFRLMDDNGWIAREQILGDEARSKVPPEFQVQYPHFANPPTLFLVLEVLLNKLENRAGGDAATTDAYDEVRSRHLRDRQQGIEYLRELYPLLKKHYEWYRTTQTGDIKSYDREAFSSKEAYRWRGRTVDHLLPSGMDDYPRPQPPHPGEIHVDLMSWMALMTRSMKRIAQTLEDSDDIAEYSRYEEGIVRNIDDLLWDSKEETFCDATIDAFEENVHVCHKGYLSLFPFMTGLLPADSPRLGPILDLIESPEELWSSFGIRSLSRRDEFYGQGENYWRSPIWINLNYLILKNLQIIAKQSGPHQEQARRLFNSLRQNLVENIYNQWVKTGFAWEQYNPDTGDGQRTQHFTGWTSLVVNIMAMPELPAGHDEL